MKITNLDIIKFILEVLYYALLCFVVFTTSESLINYFFYKEQYTCNIYDNKGLVLDTIILDNVRSKKHLHFKSNNTIEIITSNNNQIICKNSSRISL